MKPENISQMEELMASLPSTGEKMGEYQVVRAYAYAMFKLGNEIYISSKRRLRPLVRQRSVEAQSLGDQEPSRASAQAQSPCAAPRPARELKVGRT